jgi:hypothetical protein
MSLKGLDSRLEGLDSSLTLGSKGLTLGSRGLTLFISITFMKRMGLLCMGFEPMTSALQTEHVTVLSISKGYKHRALPTTPTEPVVKMGFEPMRANTAVLKTAPLDQLGHFTTYTMSLFFNFTLLKCLQC